MIPKPISSSVLKKLQNKEYRDAYVDAHVSKRIAYQIKAIRKARGLTQEQMARVLEIKQSTLSRLEDVQNKSLSIKTLKEIASKLDVAVIIKLAPYSEFLCDIADLSESKLEIQPYSAEESNLPNIHYASGTKFQPVSFKMAGMLEPRIYSVPPVMSNVQIGSIPLQCLPSTTLESVPATRVLPKMYEQTAE